MDDGSRLPWIIAVLLLFAAAYFAVTETAIASVSRNRIRTRAERGDQRAEKVLFILDNFDKAITTILICTNIVHISAASVVTVAVTKRFGISAVSVSTIITTVAVFFFGEMLPKSIAKKYSERFSLSTAGLLCFFMKLFSPFAAFLAWIGRGVAERSSGDPEVSVTEGELYDIIENMTEEGALDEEQGELISSAIQFGDLTVENILTPRVDLIAIDIDEPIDEVLATVQGCSHSRLPVYEGSIDNIIGVLQIRKFIKAYLRSGKETVLRPLLDKAFFVHQSTNIDDLLPQMSSQKNNIAVVTDNYGGTVGIVSIEDILEELVGEIWDEDDKVEEPIVKLPDDSFQIEAEETVSDAFDAMGFEDPEENEELVNTLMSEWAYQQFTVIPKVGESFDYHGLSVTVSQMDHNRILKLKAVLPPETDKGGEEA